MRNPSTLELKAKALTDYIWKTYDPQNSSVFPIREDAGLYDEDTVRTGFFRPDRQRFCRQWMEITDDCRITASAYNLVRPPKLLAEAPTRCPRAAQHTPTPVVSGPTAPSLRRR